MFAAGRLSYAKARALTRIATPATDADLAELASPMTAGQLERFVRAHRQVSAADDETARAARRVTWRVEEDGSLAMSVRLPAAEGHVMLQALRAAANDLEHPHGAGHSDDEGASAPPPDEAAPGADSLADALTSIAGAFLAGKITAADNADIYQVIVHVGPEALTAAPGQDGVPAETRAAAEAHRPAGHPAHPRRCHLEDGPAISPAAAQRIACSATVSWMLHDHHGKACPPARRYLPPPAASAPATTPSSPMTPSSRTGTATNSTSTWPSGPASPTPALLKSWRREASRR